MSPMCDADQDADRGCTYRRSGTPGGVGEIKEKNRLCCETRQIWHSGSEARTPSTIASAYLMRRLPPSSVRPSWPHCQGKILRKEPRQYPEGRVANMTLTHPPCLVSSARCTHLGYTVVLFSAVMSDMDTWTHMRGCRRLTQTGHSEFLDYDWLVGPIGRWKRR